LDFPQVSHVAVIGGTPIAGLEEKLKSLVETNYALNEIKAMYKLAQKKLGMMQNKNRSKTYEIIDDNKYSARYIARHLKEKYPSGKAYFYFKNKNDYLTLSSTGQLNVRGGEEQMFKAWGSSEFKNLKPETVFQELEKELVKIHVITAPGRESYSFNSYSQFIEWSEC
jgi:hypothetical protein